MDFFTVDKLEECVTENKKIGDWHSALANALPKYDINTPERVAGFLSQTAYESAYYTRTVENLNYSAQGLRKIFGKYFPTDKLAAAYARKPEKIANRVYANRMGNGDENSGDGWKFRGHGLIQVTGKFNHEECSIFLYNDPSVLLDKPELLTYMDGAVLSACWYWTTRKLNNYADARDITKITRLINGGTHGLETRQVLFTRMVKILD